MNEYELFLKYLRGTKHLTKRERKRLERPKMTYPKELFDCIAPYMSDKTPRIYHKSGIDMIKSNSEED